MNPKLFSITKLHTPHDKSCQIIRPLVTGCWLLVAGYRPEARSQVQRFRVKNNLEPGDWHPKPTES
jgi:hypothetical protein